MRPLRVLLVDDEEPARDRLRRLLGEIGGVELVGDAADGDAALERIAALAPDLVLLDIEMPGRTGMEVAKRLSPPRPRIVFCTAYDQYALEAFEQRAADYLLKPVSRARLAETVERVRRAIDEVEHWRREVDDAGRTQRRLLPQRLPPLAGLDYRGATYPARGVGGDYYDFLGLGARRIGLVLGDVSGKGLAAGLLLAGLQARVQTLASRHGTKLEDLAAELNRALHSALDSHRYASLFYAVYDDVTRELTYLNAGHPPALVLRPAAGGGHARHRLDPGGTVIGLLPDARHRQARFELEPGDLLCLYSDGISEAASPTGEEFGVERLAASLAHATGLDAAAACDAVLADVERFSAGAAAEDDRTVIVGRVR